MKQLLRELMQAPEMHARGKAGSCALQDAEAAGHQVLKELPDK